MIIVNDLMVWKADIVLYYTCEIGVRVEFRVG